MGVYQPPELTILWKDEDAPEGDWSPAPPLRADRGSESNLLVMLPLSCLDAGDFGFDLKNRHAACFGVKADKIDRPTFAIAGVAHPREHSPTPPRQNASHMLLDAGMARVEQAVDVAGAPEHIAVEACVDGLENRPDSRDRKSAEMAALDE